jgi:hypothetical protein
MTAQVIKLRTPSFNALVEHAKAAWDRADEKKADAEDWYIRTGKLLVELKEKAEHGQWLPTLKKLGRSQQRAHELMELAEGKKTYKQERERKRKSQVKSRAKSLLRSGDLEPETYEDQSPEEQWQNSLANLCGDVLAIEAYWNKQFHGWQKFELPSHIKKLLREAATALTSLNNRK